MLVALLSPRGRAYSPRAISASPRLCHLGPGPQLGNQGRRNFPLGGLGTCDMLVASLSPGGPIA